MGMESDSLLDQKIGLKTTSEFSLGKPVGTSSRLRKAYVAANFYELARRWARARHSEAAAACSSGYCSETRFAVRTRTSRELIPTGTLASMQRPIWDI
jgi:hypothetical protein